MIVSGRGGDLHYELRGHGPVCLVPTAIGTEPYIRMMPAPLVDRLTLVHVDLRGGGRSSGDPTSLTFDEIADDFDSVREDVGARRVVVLGHSVLGILAIEYARRRPAAVSHVIAVGTPPFGDIGRLSACSTRVFEEQASEERKQVLRERLSKLPADAAPGDRMFAETPMRFFDPRFDARPLFAGSEVTPALFVHIFGALIPAWDITAWADPLHAPLLLAHGRYDFTVPASLWDGIAARLPNATVRLFERSGHQPFFEEPQAFADAVVQWMNRRDA